MKLIRFFLFLAIVFLMLPAKAAQLPFKPDTTVERLMNTFRYRAAVNILGIKLKKTERKDFDKLLYYNNQLSMSYLRLGVYDSASICAKKSIHLSVLSIDSALINDAWKVRSYSYNRSGKLDSAILYTKIMVGYAERHGDKMLMRKSITSLGTIMNQNKRYNEALKYHKSAYLLTKELKDSLSYSVMSFNMGLTYDNMMKLDSSMFYLKEALQYSLKDKHYELAMYAYLKTADVYLALGDLKKWKESTLNLYNLAEKLKNYELLSQAYCSLSNGLTKSKNYNEAILYGNKALEILKSHPYPSHQMEIDSSMYIANKAIRNFENALTHLEAYYKQKTTLLNEGQKKQLDEIHTRFKVKEKDLTITQQSLELAHRQKNIQLLLFILIIVGLGVVVYTLYMNKSHWFRKELYKKEKYLDKQLADTKQWMEGVSLDDSRKPIALKQLPDDGESSPVCQEIFSPQNTLYGELREIVEKQRLYLNPELNIQMVIKLLGTNKKYLYEAISSNSDNNFRNFVNRYRIDHAKRIIEKNIRENANSNLSELFSLCGFNNSTSFFRTFKALTGLTPKEYATEVALDAKE
jgi:AraC-like DNA-binding protein